MSEPTLADVLAELRVLTLQVRAGFAESRARKTELSTRIRALIDSIAD